MTAYGLVRPEYLALLVAVALLAALALWAEARRRRALRTFGGHGAALVSVGEARRRAKVVLPLAAALVLVVALAGPYLDRTERQVIQQGVDLVVAFDVSQSMAVRDLEPDRLRAGREFIRGLGDRMTQSRVALVLFAGEGIVRYPPTSDPTVLGGALDAISRGYRPEGGSSLAAGIAAALEAFPEEASESGRQRAIVLVSDGEDTTEQLPVAEELQRANVRLYAVGMGTPSGGPIPQYNDEGRFVGMLQDSAGREVVSRLRENDLRRLAEETGGRYWRLNDATAREMVTELRRLDVAEIASTERESVPDDRFQTFLGIAVLALLLDWLVSERRRMPLPAGLRRRSGNARPRLPGRAPAALLLALALASSCGESAADDANALYLAGEHRLALETYSALIAEHPDLPALHVNAGNALHQLGDHQRALDEYAVALRTGGAEERAVAHYQRGNTFFRMGELEAAREAYMEALREDPADRDAKFNIEVIDRMRGAEYQQGAPQGEDGEQEPGEEQGEGEGEGQPGQTGEPQQPGEAQQPGTEGPQQEGPPSTNQTEMGGPSLSDALLQFRELLTPEQALRLLDALLNEQRGIEQFLEGRRSGSGADPTY